MRQLITSIAIFLMLTSGLLAHSKVKTSSPADGDSLSEPPSSIELNFEKPARVTKVTLEHTSGDEDHDLRLDIPTKEYVKSITLSPELYGAGSYNIEWRALAKDGHAMKGGFSFTVKAE